MMRLYLFTALLSFPAILLFAQDPEGSGLLEDQDWITTAESPNAPNDQLTDLSVKIRLNDSLSWGSDILEVLTQDEIGSLKTHIRRFGSIEHVHELQLFMPVERIYEVKPYLMIKYRDKMQSEQTGKLDLQIHRDSRDEPGMYTLRLRGRLEFGRTDLAWCMEQDAGEAWRPARNGFADLVNFGIQHRTPGGTDLIAGAYRIRFGEGLFTPNLYLNQKSPDAVRVKAEGASVRLNSSFDENSLSGICIRKRLSRLDLLASLGSALVDGRPGVLPQTFTGFNPSGTHITNSEILGRDLVRRTQLLLHVNWRFDHTLIGLSSGSEWLNRSLEPELRADNQFYPRGRKFRDLGLNFRTNLGNALVFGEMKADPDAHISGVGGFILSLGRTMDLSAVARSYSNANTSWNSSAFGRYGVNRNEQGIMFGYKWYVSKYAQFNAVFDQYSRRGFTYPDPRAYAGGSDCTLSYAVHRRGRFEHQARVRLEQDQPGMGLSSLRVWVHSTREIHSKLHWTIRYQAAGRETISSQYVQSELRYKDPRWEIVYQNAWQHQNADARTNYYYEKDLIHAFHVTTLTGTAWRRMLLIDHRPVRGHRVRLKLWQFATNGTAAEFGLKLQWIYNWK